MTASSIWFLRSGRTRRARGTVIAEAPAAVKVQPTAKRWKAFWISREEVAAGRKQIQPSLALHSKKSLRKAEPSRGKR